VNFFFFTFAIFSAALFTAAYFAWSLPSQRDAQRLNARMRELRAHARRRTAAEAPDLLRRERRGAFAALGDVVAWIAALRRLQVYIDQADLKYRAADVAGVSLLLGIAVFALLKLAGLELAALLPLFSAGAASLPITYIVRVRERRLRKFEELLPDAIDLFTRSMKAGHNIHSGLETVAKETPDPVRMEFRKLMEELALGSQLEPALRNLGRRVPLLDLKFFVTAVILQRQTGANLVAVLENLSGLVRERLNMAARLKAHTAQQRFSAGLLCIMPVVAALGFWLVKPEYIRLLYTDPTGSKFLTYAVISEIVGIVVLRRMSNIRV
jgi:tight adherence protein B